MTTDPPADPHAGLSPSLYRPVVEVLHRLGALQVVKPDDLSDWSGYPDRACAPDEVLADLGDLARFLGGDDTSFTGDVLRLIAKARSSPVNLNRMAVAFPRHVIAWVMWDTMTHAAPITAETLAELLTWSHAHLREKK